jgi:hypothetical protein
MSKALEAHIEKVKQAGVLLLEDDGALVLVSCRNGEAHKYETVPLPQDRTGRRQLTRSIGQLVMQMVADARP